jgi:LmbE family N-acetylglucosaminyl deacetylase
VDPQLLIGEVVQLIRAFQPDTVLTFDREGGYGHPDHITISSVVSHAFHQAGSVDHYPEQLAVGLGAHTASYLYHSVFLRQDKFLGTELATWLNEVGEGPGTSAEFVNTLPFFARDLTTLGYVRDDVQIQWYPPGVCIIEQGEVAASLFLILSGHADLIEETVDGRKRVLARKGPGELLGETSLLGGQPSRVDIVSAGRVTCLLLVRERLSLHAPRGAETRVSDAPADVNEGRDDRRATTAIDVSRYVPQKLAAMSAHRTQFPIAPDLLIASPVQTLLGTEYFFRIHPPRAWETTFLHASAGGREHEEAA